MILIDSNIIIDARDATAPFRRWAEELSADALATGGLALNAVVLAEVCVGQENTMAVERELRAKGVNIIDLRAAARQCALELTHCIGRRANDRGAAMVHSFRGRIFL